MEELRKKRYPFLISLVGICLLLLAGYNGQRPKQIDVNGIMSIAHRGASSYAPENTNSAFRKALELGADFLECDVHLSKDGALILMHDERVDRTTDGQGFVKDFTLEELKMLDAGQKFGTDFKGEKIITLDEFLDEFYGEIGLLIEIKKPKMYPGIEEEIVALLEKYEDLSSIIIQSFDVESMRKMHRLLPDVQIAVLMKPSALLLSTKKIEDLTSFATYINFNISYTNKWLVDQVHRYDGKVLVWSKKDHLLIAKAYQYGVDGIITDYSNWPMNDSNLLVQE